MIPPFSASMKTAVKTYRTANLLPTRLHETDDRRALDAEKNVVSVRPDLEGLPGVEQQLGHASGGLHVSNGIGRNPMQNAVEVFHSHERGRSRVNPDFI